ncbi:unnamed protein product [Allacma fusca]|uniref:Vacuolar-sorting protein SNF8 n=1 Tax=Allacma fusca TaxID=39272 RepID=A0A8J2M9R4_9HEXA|nr:unnamed protein product [Allacma fusca]
MRRRAGVGAIQEKKAAQDRFKDKGSAIQENLMQELSKQLEQFKSKLESFAIKHQNAIKKDPAFREHFQSMCASIGVDPLASSKGFWSELLGMGSFYYEVAVQSVEIVLATTHMNGGVMLLGEVKSRLNKSRKKNLKNAEVSSDDIHRAMKSLNVLGKSCGVILPTGGVNNLDDAMVFCVPEELSLDNTAVVTHAVQSGMPFLTVDDLIKALGWKQSRVESVLEVLIREGIVWVDDHEGSRFYWFPSIFSAARIS